MREGSERGTRINFSLTGSGRKGKKDEERLKTESNEAKFTKKQEKRVEA